ncbi:MAG: flavin reductase family protein [bacterium]
MADFDSFRAVLRHYPTGVAVVAGKTEHGPVGLSIGTFMSVSLVPLLVGFLVDHKSTSWPPIRDVGAFCVSILGADQESLGRAFAASGGDKFRSVAWRPSPTGAPIIEGAVLWIDCSVYAEHRVGDHNFVAGQVHHFQMERDIRPLLFVHGNFVAIDSEPVVVAPPRRGGRQRRARAVSY